MENDECDSDDEREETDGEDEDKMTNDKRGRNKKTKRKKPFNDESSDLNCSRFVSAFKVAFADWIIKSLATFWANQKSLARSCLPALCETGCLFVLLFWSAHLIVCFFLWLISLTLGFSSEICHFRIVDRVEAESSKYLFFFLKNKGKCKIALLNLLSVQFDSALLKM